MHFCFIQNKAYPLINNDTLNQAKKHAQMVNDALAYDLLYTNKKEFWVEKNNAYIALHIDYPVYEVIAPSANSRFEIELKKISTLSRFELKQKF